MFEAKAHTKEVITQEMLNRWKSQKITVKEALVEKALRLSDEELRAFVDIAHTRLISWDQEKHLRALYNRAVSALGNRNINHMD